MANVNILKEVRSESGMSPKTFSFNTIENTVQLCEALGINTATWHIKENRWSAKGVIVPSEAFRIGSLKQIAMGAAKSFGRQISGGAYYTVTISD